VSSTKSGLAKLKASFSFLYTKIGGLMVRDFARNHAMPLSMLLRGSPSFFFSIDEKSG
jgi:hypothetical protein